MSKKKSYMDVDNILSEGIYDKFVDKANNCPAVMECHSITGGG